LIQQKNFFSAVIVFQFLVIKALDPDWIRIGIQPKILDPDPDEMNADPQAGQWVVILFSAVLPIRICRIRMF
jgi:hypothetical protein